MRAFALVVAIALHVVLGWLMFGATRPGERVATERPTARGDRVMREHAPDLRREAPPRAALVERTAQRLAFVSPAEFLAYREGRRNAERFIAGSAAYLRRQYDDAIVDLLEAPVRESWPQLEALAGNGVADAGSALQQLALLCDTAATMAPRAAYEKLAGAAIAEQSAEDSAYLQGLISREHEHMVETHARCGSGGYVERAAQFLDTLDRDLPPRLRAAFPGPRGLADPDPDDRTAAGGTTRVDDAQTEGRASDLIRAQTGVDASIDGVVATALRDENRPVAVAWLDYQRWLHRSACRVDASSFHYARASRAATRMRRTMPEAERDAADAEARELIETYGPIAQRKLDCPAGSGL